MPLRRIALIIEYDGTEYCGFQLQKGIPTIQAELEEAYGKLTGESRRFQAASRTDSGVHAFGQVVSFKTGLTMLKDRFKGGLNRYLPKSIAIKEAFEMPTSFDVRHANSREYHYNTLISRTRSPIQDRFSYRLENMPNIEQMNSICQQLIGTHDFTSFASNLGGDSKKMERRVYLARFDFKDNILVFRIVANSFLPHQVRNMVGSLLEVGFGRISNEDLLQIWETRKLGLAQPAVPSRGLVLVKINYEKSLRDLERR
jgi:tRNA pseudouridine38-40 synthase